MKKLFRCYACKNEKGLPGRDFTAELPVCECGIDARLPRFAHLIVTREVIHFDAPFDHPELCHSMGVGYPACDPAKKIGEQFRASGEPLAVNCPVCIETAAFKKKQADADTRGVVPERDTPILNVEPGGGIVLESSKPAGE